MSEARPPDPRSSGSLKSGRSKDRDTVHYQAHLLPDAKATEQGILYRRGDERFLLAWDRVRRALAAVIGDPELECTVVFDLAVEVSPNHCVVYRLDTAPEEPAARLARAIVVGVGSERCTPGVTSLAEHGKSSLDYPDLPSFEAAALESLRFAASRL